uniref:Stabilizer of axonemal microtubules 2 n=1 Tax=Echinostoma caproni TaxID=27848 RepID=A0A183ACI1_9TREM
LILESIYITRESVDPFPPFHSQLCKYSRHKCPHNARKSQIRGPCGVSEYTTKYVPYDVKPVESYKPPHRGVDTHGEMASETTHRVDFVPHPLSTQTSCKKEIAYESPTVAFDGLSTYTKEFTPDYRLWELEARKRPAATEWTPPTVRFGGIPTYTSDYIGHSAAFESDADQIIKDAYRQHLITERAHPIINKECTQKATVPMEHLSTHMQDYGWKTSVPPSSCKPIHTEIQNKEPFAQDTTHRADYREWPSDRAHPITPSVSYRPPSGEMSGDTTYMADYVPHAWSRNQLFGPKHKRQLDLPPFEGMSDYRDSYRAWSVVGKPRVCSPDNAYRSPSVPFDGRSTSKQHYVPHWGHHPAESCKPQVQPLSSETAFDDATIYRAEYTAKHLDPCPAALLNTKMSLYRFEQENEEGHMIYYRNTDEGNSFSPNTDKMDTHPNISTAVAVAN